MYIMRRSNVIILIGQFCFIFGIFFEITLKKKFCDTGHNVNPEEVEGIKEAISILENHDTGHKQGLVHQGDSTIQVVTPLPFLDERNNHKIQTANETSPVYRGNRNYNESSRKNSLKPKPSAPRPEPVLQTAEFKLVTVNADMNFSKKDISTENSSKGSSSESAERKHRRRMTLKNNLSTSTDNGNKLTNTTMTTSPATVLLANQDFQTNYNVTKQEKLTDQLENSDKINPNTLKDIAGSTPVRRFYRSSAESSNNKEDTKITLTNNEMVQIVTPTPMAKLVGEHATPTATIEKLDAAVLGPSAFLRVKKEALIVAAQENGNVRSKPNRYGT